MLLTCARKGTFSLSPVPAKNFRFVRGGDNSYFSCQESDVGSNPASPGRQCLGLSSSGLGRFVLCCRLFPQSFVSGGERGYFSGN